MKIIIKYTKITSSTCVVYMGKYIIVQWYKIREHVNKFAIFGKIFYEDRSLSVSKNISKQALCTTTNISIPCEGNMLMLNNLKC